MDVCFTIGRFQPFIYYLRPVLIPMTTSRFNQPLVIINPVSGNGKASCRYEAEKASLDALYPRITTYFTQCTGDFEGIQRAITDARPDLLIVFGGDGTLNDVVNGSQGEIPVAIVPVGSGNDFASLLGIKKRTNLTDRLRNPEIRKVDLGQCNGRWFVNGLGIGFDGEIARRTVSNTSALPSFMKYYLAILRSILFYKESESVIVWDEDESTKNKFLMITVANGKRYGGSFKVAPPGKPDDGLLDLVLIGKVHPLLRPVYLPLVIVGRHLNLSFVRHLQVKKVTIRSNRILPAHTDGELMLSNRYEVCIYPGRLGFVV